MPNRYQVRFPLSSLTQLQPPPITRSQAAIVDCVRSYVGFSLEHNAESLRAFIARGVDDPGAILSEGVSDCGLFALAVWHAMGVNHELVRAPYQSGKAVTWLLEIASDLNAVRRPLRDGPPKPGALMHYKTSGRNNDHVEFCLSFPYVRGAMWIAQHGGGGGAHCAIGSSQSDVKWSWSRPMQAWFDPDILLARLSHETPNDDSEFHVPQGSLDASESSSVADTTPPPSPLGRREDSVQISTARPFVVQPPKLSGH